MPEREVRLTVSGRRLGGTLAVPVGPRGSVLFAHGSESSRRSPRNRFLASVRNEGPLATLLFDLLIEEEGDRDALSAELRFDVDSLAGRLVGATNWALSQVEIRSLPLSYFGSSTRAAAALIAASPGALLDVAQMPREFLIQHLEREQRAVPPTP